MPGIQADGPPLFWKYVPDRPSCRARATTSLPIWSHTGNWLAVGITKTRLPCALLMSNGAPGGANAGTPLAFVTTDSSVDTCAAVSPPPDPEAPAAVEHAAPAKPA